MKAVCSRLHSSISAFRLRPTTHAGSGNWDRAATPDGGCYTAGTLLAFADGNWYIEHVVHGRWEPDTRDDQILAAALRDRQRDGPHHEPVIYIEQEPGSSGVDAVKHIVRKLNGFCAYGDRPTGPKEVRAEPWASQCAQRMFSW